MVGGLGGDEVAFHVDQRPAVVQPGTPAISAELVLTLRTLISVSLCLRMTPSGGCLVEQLVCLVGGTFREPVVPRHRPPGNDRTNSAHDEEPERGAHA